MNWHSSREKFYLTHICGRRRYYLSKLPLRHVAHMMIEPLRVAINQGQFLVH